MDTSVLMDTMVLVAQGSIEPWYAHYFFELVSTLLLTVVVPALATYRASANKKTKAIMDAAVFAFNQIERASKLVPSKNKARFKKIVEFEKAAGKKYAELTGVKPSDNILTELKHVAENLVFNSKKNS